ncbi:hypothetical protein Golax_009848, partial [Gossypium laxum]|nr:hypothetical protein [Gossypium laxum]
MEEVKHKKRSLPKNATFNAQNVVPTMKQVVEDIGEIKKAISLTYKEHEEDNVLKATKSKLDDANVVLKKFGGQSEELDEILALRRTEPSHRGL